jgi:hypothetical protein
MTFSAAPFEGGVWVPWPEWHCAGPRSPRDGSEVQNPVRSLARRGSLVADSCRCVEHLSCPICCRVPARFLPASSNVNGTPGISVEIVFGVAEGQHRFKIRALTISGNGAHIVFLFGVSD